MRFKSKTPVTFCVAYADPDEEEHEVVAHSVVIADGACTFLDDRANLLLAIPLHQLACVAPVQRTVGW